MRLCILPSYPRNNEPHPHRATLCPPFCELRLCSLSEPNLERIHLSIDFPLCTCRLSHLVPKIGPRLWIVTPLPSPSRVPFSSILTSIHISYLSPYNHSSLFRLQKLDHTFCSIELLVMLEEMKERPGVNYGHLAVYLCEKGVVIEDVGRQECCLYLIFVFEQVIAKFDKLWSKV